MKRKSNSGERGKEKKIRKGEKAQIFWEGRKNIPAVTGKFSERNQTSTDLEEKEGERRIRRVGRVDIIARSGESVRYSCYETRVRPSVVNDQLWLATRTRPWRWPTFGPPRLLRWSSTKGTDGYYSPRSWSSFSVSRCVYTRNREWNAPLYPRSLEFPLLQAVINRPRNFVNSTVYIPWNGCTPKSEEIEVDFEYIYIYIYIFFIRGKISIRISTFKRCMREKKFERFLLYAICTILGKIQGVDRKKSYYFPTVIDRLNRLIFTGSRC